MLFLFLFHFYSWENCQNVNKISQKQIWHQNTYSLDLWLIFSRFTSFHLSVGFWDVPLRDRDHEHNILGRTYKIFGRKTKAGNLLERAPTRGAAKKKRTKAGETENVVWIKQVQKDDKVWWFPHGAPTGTVDEAQSAYSSVSAAHGRCPHS